MFKVGVAGGSGSGKTTFVKKIQSQVGSSDIDSITLDSYYLPTPNPTHMQGGHYNYDHPDAFDWDLLHQHLTALEAGGPVRVPIYDYLKNQRSGEFKTVGPLRGLLLEGLYTLQKRVIRDLFDVRVFLHVEADIRFIRRLHRDIKDRGRTVDGVIDQYYNLVRPMHQQFVELTQRYADIIVGEENDIAAEALAARMIQALK